MNGWKKVRAGLYEKEINGQKVIIEHVTKSMGFKYNEWHSGTENDPHANQHKSLREAIESYEIGDWCYD